MNRKPLFLAFFAVLCIVSIKFGIKAWHERNDRIIGNRLANDYNQYLTKFSDNHSRQAEGPLTASQECAYEIMGKDGYYGLRAISNNLGIEASDEQIAQLAEIPYSPEQLEGYKNTCVLVAFLPISGHELEERAKQKNFKIPISDDHVFGQTDWVLVGTQPLWARDTNEETATTEQMLYSAVVYYLDNDGAGYLLPSHPWFAKTDSGQQLGFTTPSMIEFGSVNDQYLMSSFVVKPDGVSEP